jgi:sterol desaturase/sphingolipid hydroxylase (fatty acid hydroxylase superfamily)
MPIDWVRLEVRIFWYLFAALFLGVAIWETLAPRAAPTQSTARRWGVNGWLLLASSIVSVTVIRFSPVGVALAVAGRSWPSLERMPAAAAFVVTLLALDAWAWAGHRFLHATRWGWRIHQVHHSDMDYDVTTGSRFHPIEMLFLKSGQLAVVFLLGPPALAVLIAEMAGLMANFFQHANGRLASVVSRALRRVIVTPEIHRIHHSLHREEQQKNFGQLFPWWDRLAGTYQLESASGLAGPVGVASIRRHLSYSEVLLLPFQKAQRPAATSAAAGRVESGDRRKLS